MFVEGFLKKYMLKKKYSNIIEAIYWNTFVRKIAGLSVMEVISVGGSLESNMSTLGLLGFLIFCITYISCVLVAYSQDQTIIRIIFDTKLKQYGDLFEKIATVSFVIYVMIKMGWKLSNDTKFAQMVVDVDKFITDMSVVGVSIDYVRYAISSIYMIMAQEILWMCRVLSIFVILYGQEAPIPFGKIYQGAYSDGLALGISSAYCYSLFIWKDKYEHLNTILRHIRDKKMWEQTFFIRIKGSDTVKATQLQDKYICEKIRMCSRLCTKLYDGIEHINGAYGISLAITIFVCINYIILYMFYFMEATAAGLFHDFPRYTRLLVFVFWQIGYATFVFIVLVYFAELALTEAKKTSFIVHEIIQKDFSPAVKAEAMQFSVQLLHQVPILKAHGLYVINYAILYEGGRYVLQFLVMLLQFVDTK
ncbi:putative gustatory receptor 28b [Amyelois transitella]|uniref:putative gustatory receptor 28b n=1 Tax=Amyelois transitella TaxID=680683 RepID=UPI00298F7109|nr:putative gustatory receptor 28b [Amyelois transitella]